MPKQYIAFSCPKPDNHFHYSEFAIKASNGITTSEIKFYTPSDFFKEFGTQLLDFPKSVKDEVVLHIKEPYANIKLRAYCHTPLGHCAIEVIFDNEEAAPKTMRCEFHILTIPGSVNRLGDRLRKWDFLNEEITWIPE